MRVMLASTDTARFIAAYNNLTRFIDGLAFDRGDDFQRGKMSFLTLGQSDTLHYFRRLFISER